MDEMKLWGKRRCEFDDTQLQTDQDAALARLRADHVKFVLCGAGVKLFGR